MKIIPPGGKHLIVDLFGCDRNLLSGVDDISYVCRAAAVRTGATVIEENFHHFGESFGVSGVLLLAESHLSIHTWPEEGYASLDVYVCGECDPTRAFAVLAAGLRAESHSSMLINRGDNGPKTVVDFSRRSFVDDDFEWK